MIFYPETSSSVPIEWLEFLNFGRLAWEKPPIAASPVFSLFYVVLIPTYIRNQDFGKEWLKQILKYFVSNML